jgi:hypothetical protein
LVGEGQKGELPPARHSLLLLLHAVDHLPLSPQFELMVVVFAA